MRTTTTLPSKLRHLRTLEIDRLCASCGSPHGDDQSARWRCHDCSTSTPIALAEDAALLDHYLSMPEDVQHVWWHGVAMVYPDAECAERICAIQPRGSGVGKVKFRRDAYQKFKGLAGALRDMHYVVELKGNVRS